MSGLEDEVRFQQRRSDLQPMRDEGDSPLRWNVFHNSLMEFYGDF
jgi:hypothetical protein